MKTRLPYFVASLWLRRRARSLPHHWRARG